MVFAGGKKDQEGVHVGFPDLFGGIHAGHAVHIYVQKDDRVKEGLVTAKKLPGGGELACGQLKVVRRSIILKDHFDGIPFFFKMLFHKKMQLTPLLLTQMI